MQMQRVVGRLGLLFVSISAMVGSGWLFGSLYAAQIAGPAAVISWVLGGSLVIVVSFTFAELGAMLPVTGGIARFPQFTHGTLVSFVMTWIAWIAYALLPPIEVQALIQYASNYLPWLVYQVDGKPALSGEGFGVAILLLLFMCYLNIVGVRFITRLNNYLVWLKLLIPTLTAVVLITVAFHAGNFTQHGGFAPYGLKGILTSLPMAGVVFSFFGFRISIELAGEAKNPQKALPLALIGGLVITIVLYTLVQFAFIGAVSPADLAGGWKNLAFAGDAGPFVGLAAGLGIGWLVTILYADAVISPFGSALMVVTTTARLDYAMAVNRYVPKGLAKLNKKGVPHVAIMVNFVVGALLLLPFPGWQRLATFILAALVISHSIAPISLVALRKQVPDMKRPFRLPYATGFSLLAFIILALLTYWTGWNTLWKMYVGAIIGLIFLFIYRFIQGEDKPPLHWDTSKWMVPYFVGMALISYLGDFGGGIQVIPFGWDMLTVALFATVIFFMAIKQCLSPEEAQAAIAREQQLLNVG